MISTLMLTAGSLELALYCTCTHTLMLPTHAYTCWGSYGRHKHFESGWHLKQEGEWNDMKWMAPGEGCCTTHSTPRTTRLAGMERNLTSKGGGGFGGSSGCTMHVVPWVTGLDM